MKYASVLTALLLAASAGCASYDSAGADFEPRGPESGTPGASQDAIDQLYLHDVTAARDLFRQAPSTDAHAMVGLAVTEFLTIPMAPETTRLLGDSLGATRPLQNQTLYGEGGLFYLISLGVSWEDGDSVAGIRTALGEELPWKRERLESVEGFVEGLNDPVDLLAANLVRVADGPLQRVREAAGLALENNEGFAPFLLPGSVFFDTRLEIRVGSPEVALLDAFVSGVQAATYAFAAYEHSWTIERAFGTAIWQPVVDDPMSEQHVDGFTVEQYQVAHLNAAVLRRIKTPNLLLKSQDALGHALGRLADGFEFGVEAAADATLGWSGVDDVLLENLVETIRGFEAAVRGPSEVPNTAPPLTADLTPLFSPGRTLPDEIDLIRSEEQADDFGTYTATYINDQAIETFVEGLFDPEIGENGSELDDADQLDDLINTIFGTYSQNVETAVDGSF